MEVAIKEEINTPSGKPFQNVQLLFATIEFLESMDTGFIYPIVGGGNCAQWAKYFAYRNTDRDAVIVFFNTLTGETSQRPAFGTLPQYVPFIFYETSGVESTNLRNIDISDFLKISEVEKFPM
jgi:hypothetical protein